MHLVGLQEEQETVSQQLNSQISWENYGINPPGSRAQAPEGKERQAAWIYNGKSCLTNLIPS